MITGTAASGTVNQGLFISNNTIVGSNTSTGTITLMGNATGNSSIETSGTILSQSGDITLTGDRSILLNSNAEITSTDGDITLRANQGTTPTAGNFVGIKLNDATITTNGTGNILLEGRGGDQAGTAIHHGIFLTEGSLIESTATTATDTTAGITLRGLGGAGTTDNMGIRIGDNNGGTVRSSAGAILLVGTGGAGTGGAFTAPGKGSVSGASRGMVLVTWFSRFFHF